MSPQFCAAASISRIEVECITDEYLHVLSGQTVARPAVDISHLPSRMIRGIMSPQFCAAASISRIEVERITDEHLHVISGVTAARPAVDISHLPR